MMKRIRKNVLAMLLLAVCLLPACGPTGVPGKEETGEELVYSDLDASAIIALDGRDNTMDAYMYTMREELTFDDKDGSVVYNLTYAMGEKILRVNAQHEGDDYWQEFVSMDQSGAYEAEKRAASDEKADMGTVAGTDQYIFYVGNVDETNPDLIRVNYEFQVMNEQGECSQILPVPHVSQSFTPEEELFINGINDLIMDKEGTVYFIYSDIKKYWDTGEEQDRYLDMLSDTGELVRINLGRDTMNHKLLAGNDGSILLFDGERTDKGQGIGLNTRLHRVDKEKGELQLIASIEDEYPGKIHCAAMLDENNLVYANNTALYKLNLQTEETEELYKWVNHGISLTGVETMRIYEDGRIALLYREGKNRWHYISLSPVTEKLPMQTIIFATTEDRARMFRPMIADFNKQHPNCIVEMKTDYDQTVLLTQLIAGDGPVLIDTLVTGFAENKKLWEPLDNVLTDLGVYEQLLPNVMELGEIDGQLFGITDSFLIDTVVTGAADLQNWNYETFIQCMEEGKYGTTIVNSTGMEKDGWSFLMGFFEHGVEDCYLFDAQSGETIFDKKDFRNLLQLTKQYVVNQEYTDVADKLLDGTVLCARVSIDRPEVLAVHRMIYDGEINYIGYPGKDGSSSYLTSSPPLAVRRTADKEDKALAVAFLAYMLSYDAQMDMKENRSFHLSVRKDVLEAQIEAMTEDTIVWSGYFGDLKLKDHMDKARDRETLYNLIENAKPMPETPGVLVEIMGSELIPYFEGKITEDALIKNLTSRVGLYLEERR